MTTTAGLFHFHHQGTTHMHPKHDDTPAAEARATLQAGIGQAAQDLHRETMLRLHAFQAAQDSSPALVGAPWLADMIASAFTSGNPGTPDLEAAALYIPKEVARRVWALPLPISKRLYAVMKWRRRGGAWKEQPTAEAPVFYFARGWALAEAFGLNLGELAAEPMEHVEAELKAAFGAPAGEQQQEGARHV